MQNKFSFTGHVLLPKDDAKRPFVNESKSKAGNPIINVNFGIKAGESNLAYVEGFDGKQDTIKTMDTDNNKIEVSWNDRLDEEVVKTVAGYKKHTIDLGDDYGGRQDFVTLYDAIKYLQEWLPKYSGKVTVTGQFTKEYYPKNDTYYDKFKIQNIYAVSDDVKDRLALTMDVYYNKDCIDKTDFKDEQKIYLNGYIEQYINKDEGSKYISQQFVFSSAKYNMENEDHVKKLNYKMKYIDINNKTFVHIPWEIVLLRGAEEVEFNESMLTDAQREQVEFKIKTIDDFKPRGNIFGDKISEYRLYDPVLKNFNKNGDFSDGVVDTEMKTSEFEDMVYKPAKDEKLDDVIKEAKKESAKKIVEVEVDDEDLF